MGNNKTRCIKSYYVDTQEYLDKKKDEMIKIADTTGCRIYIHPARRNKNKIALQLLSYVADCISTNTNNKMWRSYETVCWRNLWEDKLWIVDVDSKNFEEYIIAKEHIAGIRPYREPAFVIPTVNWCHMIYKWWFDMSQYELKRDIHKNNPTLLYAPELLNTSTS